MTEPMNGADSLVKTLLDSGGEVCFTNPGTSEMHFVAALDHVPNKRLTRSRRKRAGIITRCAPIG